MRILITGSLVFLLWCIFASWLYVSSIKPSFEKPADKIAVKDSIMIKPSAPVVPETPKPEPMLIYFGYKQADVKNSPELEKQSHQFLAWIEKHPETTLYITGHSDSKGSEKYNLSLGLKRAGNTEKLLASLGIPKEKMKTESKGESAPLADNSSDEGRAKNRRVEITLK